MKYIFVMMKWNCINIFPVLLDNTYILVTHHKVGVDSMLEGNTDEIRMEIRSCFVKKHEYWERRRGARNWIARIRGLDRQYGYKREFLEMVQVGGEKVFHLEDFHLGGIYEIASIYTAGKSQYTSLRGTYECVEVRKDQITLRYATQDEVFERLSGEDKSLVAENLVQQLLKVVTKDQAVNLIHQHG